MKSKCPVCKLDLDVTVRLESGWNVIPHFDHAIVVWVDDKGNVREVYPARTVSAPVDGLEIDQSKLDLVPTSIDMSRISLILDGKLTPSEADLAAIRVLLRLGVIRPKGG